MSRIRTVYESPLETVQGKEERYSKAWVGEVIRVNTDDETVDIDFITYNTQLSSVPYFHALSGPRGFLGGSPEEGSIALVDWAPNTARGNPQPFVVGFRSKWLPLSKEFLRSHNLDPDTGERDPVRGMRPSLRQGEVGLVSSAQSGVVANQDLLLFSGGLGEVLLRSSDTALLSKFLQRYEYAANSRELWGMAERNGASPYPLEDESGRELHYVTVGDQDMVSGAEAWVERRTELEEVSTGGLSLVDSVHGSYASSYPYSLVHVLGTLVGNDPASSLFGKPLTRRVCSGSTLSPQYLESVKTKGPSSTSYFHMSFPSMNESSVDVDKQGRAAILLDSNPDRDNLSLELGLRGKLCLAAEDDLSVASTGDAVVDVEGDLSLLADGTAYLDGEVVYLGLRSSPTPSVSGRDRVAR